MDAVEEQMDTTTITVGEMSERVEVAAEAVEEFNGRVTLTEGRLTELIQASSNGELDGAGTKYRPLCAGMFAALIGILVHSFFESLWEEPYMMALFFIVAAMLIYAGFLRQPREDGEK